MRNRRLRALGTALGVVLAGYGTAGCPWNAAPVDAPALLDREDAGARSFELRILDPSESLSLVRSSLVAKTPIWISDSLLAGMPSRALTVEAGSKLYPTGTVTILDGSAAPAARSASIVSFVERPTERFLVIGSGHAEIQFANGASSIVASGPDTEVVRIDSAPPASPCTASSGTEAQLSWTGPVHGDTYRTIVSQTWEGAPGCIKVVFDDGERLSACFPKSAWPFQVGDAVRMPVNGRDDRRLEIHGTDEQHDMLALERGKVVPDLASPDVTVQVGDLQLALRPEDSCRAVNAACGTSRVPATMFTVVDGKSKKVPRGGPLDGDDRLRIELRWILTAWIEPVESSSCSPTEEPPAPRGASVEIVTRIKQPRR